MKLLLIALFSSLLVSCNGDDFTLHTNTKGIKVAFIGDQGAGRSARAVLQLIRDEQADMVLHQGDFDYEDDPDLWMNQINSILGPEFPYFASVGNHDLPAWEGYQQRLQSRLERTKGASCTGDLGVNSACTFNGIFFVLSGVGTLGEHHVEYLQTELTTSNAQWKICSWHKNQHLMQVGGKPDEVGWEAYETCRLAGAIIATGHEHSYSRTHLMDSFEFQSVSSTSNQLILSEGESFAFVSGLGGFSIRPEVNNLGSNPWWASVYTSDNNANHGALFCNFNTENNANDAFCYFKDIDGKTVDSFTLISHLKVTLLSKINNN